MNILTEITLERLKVLTKAHKQMSKKEWRMGKIELHFDSPSKSAPDV